MEYIVKKWWFLLKKMDMILKMVVLKKNEGHLVKNLEKYWRWWRMSQIFPLFVLKMFFSMVGGLKNGRKGVLAGPKGLENLLEGKNGSKVENSMFLFKMVKKYC